MDFPVCKTCHGKGTLKSHHPDALPHTGRKSNISYPDIIFSHSGEIMSDPNLSYCGICHGTGIKSD